MSKQNLISIIVPIYKVEKYLSKCVESIISQTYTNLEIILVDDGSPDNCGNICDEYAKRDSRIKVIHKPNGGLSDARNAGIDVANGEYLAFLDSDDYVDPNYIENLLSAIKQNHCDIAICNFNIVDEEGKVIEENRDLKCGYYSDALQLFYGSQLSTATVVAWNKLYNRAIFNNLRYPVGKIHEDEFVIFDVLNNAKNGVVVINDKLHYYVQQPNSITAAKTPSKKMLDGYYCAKHRLQRIIQLQKTEFINFAVAQLFLSYVCVYKKIKTNKELKKILLDDFKIDYKNYKKYLNSKRKIKYFMFKHFPNLTIKLC